MKAEKNQTVRISDQVEQAARQKHLTVNRVRSDLVLVLGDRPWAFKGFMGPSTSNVGLKFGRNWSWMTDYLGGRGFPVAQEQPRPGSRLARLPVVGDSIIDPIIPEHMEPWGEELRHTAVRVIKAMPGADYGCVNMQIENSHMRVASLNMSFDRWAVRSSDESLLLVADRIVDHELEVSAAFIAA